MKTKRTKIVILGLLIAASLSFVAFVSATYNSEEDPLVTLSYLTDVLVPQMKSQIISSLSGNTGNSASNIYQVVELTYGKKILAKNSLELILRPGGSAIVVSPVATQGISDLTSGTELLNNTNLSENHSCLIPRGDGRGILITSEKAYIMIRGEYEIG